MLSTRKMGIYGLIGLGVLLGSLVITNKIRAAEPAPAAIVVGKVQADRKCIEDHAMAWLSKGDILLYQAEVRPGGSFEFHTLPGEYQVVVNSPSGCFAEKTVKTVAGRYHRFLFKIVPEANRAPAHKTPAVKTSENEIPARNQTRAELRGRG